MFERYSDEEIATMLKYELDNAPTVNFHLDAYHALKLVGLLQLACRHPQIQRSDLELVKGLADQIKQIGPAVAECINCGWDPTYDKGSDARKKAREHGA